MAHVGKLFPGANVRLAGDSTGATWAERVIRLLHASEAPSVPTSELGNVLRREWRKISRDVLTPEFLAALDGMGWPRSPQPGAFTLFGRKVASRLNMCKYATHD